LLWVDLGDVVDADYEPLAPEQTSPNFEPFGLVRRFSVADAGYAADLFGRGLYEETLATAKPVGVVVARAGRVVPPAFLVSCHEFRLSGGVGRGDGLSDWSPPAAAGANDSARVPHGQSLFTPP